MISAFMRCAGVCLVAAAASFAVSSGNASEKGTARSEDDMKMVALLGGGRSDKPEGLSIPIEDSLFYLSPGDRLKLRWWGVGSGSEELQVSTGWKLVIPDRGVLSVRGRTLRQIKASVDSLLRAQLKVRILDLQLTDVGKAQVQITGLVPSPGSVEIDAGEHLSTVLTTSGFPVRELLRAQAASPPIRPGDRYQVQSLRRIQLIRGSGHDTIWCDLAKAFNAGELEHDPRVFSGDRIRVFSQGPVVAISGDVPFAGFIELVPGETVESLARVTGLVKLPQQVTILDRDGKRFQAGLQDKLDSNVAVLELPPVQRRQPAKLVWISGYVQRPGGYVYEQGVTARQLLAKAGGGLSANEDSCVLVGIKRGWIWLQAGRRQGIELTTQYPEVRTALLGYQQHMRGTYSDPDVPLQPGDSVVIHQAEQVVWVGGQVNRPGFVPWKKGASVDDYVEAAGGYADRAWTSRTRTYDLYTDQLIQPDHPVRAGAAIVVPERRYLYFDQWLTLGATLVSTVVSVMYFYVATSKQ